MRYDLPGFLDRLATIFGVTTEETAHQRESVLPTTGERPPAIDPDDPRLPDAARPKVARLLAVTAEVEARAERDPSLSAATAEVRRMRDGHLPQLVSSYADIPPAHRAAIFRETRRSASFKLNEAIDRMIARAERLSRSLAEEDIASFSDTLRFIDQRYGDGAPD